MFLNNCQFRKEVQCALVALVSILLTSCSGIAQVQNPDSLAALHTFVAIYGTQYCSTGPASEQPRSPFGNLASQRAQVVHSDCPLVGSGASPDITCRIDFWYAVRPLNLPDGLIRQGWQFWGSTAMPFAAFHGADEAK